MLKYKIRFLLGIIFSLSIISCNQQQTTRSWSHFRGSQLNGISEETGFPIIWSDSTNIEWKVEIEGKGWSSPVILGDQIWLTTTSDDNKEMSAVCHDFNTGEEIFNLLLFKPDTIFRIHAINSYATPTSCIEEGFVYTHFGRYGTACIDTKTGKIVWKRNDLECVHIQGAGASPIIYKDKLILHVEGIDVQFIYALDKRTGEIIWKTERPQELYDLITDIGKKAYITPLVINLKGKDVMISNGSAVCIAYDIETGKEIWRIPQGEDSTVSMPIESDGVIYFYTSFITPEEGEKYCELFAVDPNGVGDISQTNILWRVQSPMLQLLTPVVKDGLLYTIDAQSKLLCLDAKTGETIWSEKLNGKFHSSPIWAEGKVYVSSLKGETYVYRAGRNKELLATNKLQGGIWSTPAFLNGHILMRTSKFLYNISIIETN
ncbi:MAG: PQQ-binding-like beta-propeller repeat protein [Bacteroidales bacterium]|nr:PQQ-binding-like beta-propeller repeat protein [Bacteroidales bacterium]